MAEGIDIAAALERGVASELEALAPKVQAASEAEAARAADLRARALDASLPQAEAEALHGLLDALAAEFKAKRAQAAAEAVVRALDAARDRDAQAALTRGYEATRKARDKAARALAARYAILADELAGLLADAHAADALVMAANEALPRGAARLEPTETAAGRPGAGPLTRPLHKTALPAWAAGAAPLWGPSQTLMGGWRRSTEAKETT